MDADVSPVYGHLRNPSMVDFAGHMSAVFFVSGCNFRCGFCHNADLMHQAETGLRWDYLEHVCQTFLANWVDGAVISGGEPTLSDALDRLIALFRRMGWAVKLDTNGSRPDVLRACMDRVDYVAMDIKAGLSGYPDLTGFEDTGRLRESVTLVQQNARDYEFRTTVIEPFHTDAQMHEIGSLIKGARRYVLQPFVPRDNLPDEALSAVPRTSQPRMQQLKEIMSAYADEISVRGETV